MKTRRRIGQTRTFLLLGFGGLLVLLALTGLNALSVVKRIEVRNRQIRIDYLNRDRILEQLRADIYQSGTYVRDFLIDPDPSHAEIHKREFETARARIESMAERYRGMLRPEERSSFQAFQTGLLGYFRSLEPALGWGASERRARGYEFMRDSLLPRRTVVVHLADQIAQVNQRQTVAGTQQVSDLFGSFRRLLVEMLALTLVVGVVLAGFSVRRILRLEELSETRFTEATQARSALEQLSTRLLEVQEQERKSISRELHDEVGQSLSALVLGLGNLDAAVHSGGQGEIRQQIRKLRDIAERNVAIVRDMSLLLRPSMLDDLGLVPALQWQAREMLRRHGVPVAVAAASPFEDLSDEYKTCIYRVVQEALTNVARHAAAQNVSIALATRDNMLMLTIADDGRGFEPSFEKGLGLLGMEERIRALSGRLRIESKRGAATTLTVELPLVPPVSS